MKQQNRDLSLSTLAKKLGTTRQSLLAWRKAWPDAPASRDPAEWEKFMESHDLGRFARKHNGPIPKTLPSDSGQPTPNLEHALRLRERQLAVETAEHKLAVQKGEVLPLSEYQDALRVTVGAFDAALKAIPGRAAEKIMEAARTACLAMLRTALTAKQWEKAAPELEKAPLDHATITRLLDDQIEACRRVLAEADFLQPAADELP